MFGASAVVGGSVGDVNEMVVPVANLAANSALIISSNELLMAAKVSDDSDTGNSTSAPGFLEPRGIISGSEVFSPGPKP